MPQHFTMHLPSHIKNFVFFKTILYSTFFPKESVLFTKDAICNTTSNVIDIFYMDATTTTDHLISLLYRQCATPVLLNNLKNHTWYPQQEIKLSNKVLIINSLDQVDAIMDVVYEFRFKKYKRKYFVIVEWTQDYNQAQWLYYLFAKFWRKQILNVVVIFHKRSLQIYTYRLMADDGSINANISTPTETQEQNFNLHVMNITNYPVSRWFFNKLTDLQGRKLVVTMFPLIPRAFSKKNGPGYTGLDGHVAELLRSRMNATFTYIQHVTYFNGSNNTGIVDHLLTQKADFAFNVMAYDPKNFNETVEITNAFDHNKFCVIVPRNGIEPIYYNFFRILSPIMWTLVIVSIIVVIVVLATFQYIYKIIGNASRNHHTTYTVMEFTTIIIQSFFGETIERVTLNVSIRWILISWLIYCFLITNAFAATIIASLIRPNYLNNIDTIAELSESNLTILYPVAIEKYIRESFNNETWKLIEDNLIAVQNWQNFTEIIEKNKTQYAYVIVNYYCEHVVNSFIDAKTGKSIFHLVPECLSSHPRGYLVQRGSMYLGYINELLGQFHEFGMFRRWIAESKFYSLIRGLNVTSEADDKTIDYSTAKVVITLEYLQTPFYMLGVGLFVSSLIFCVEKLWYKFGCSRQQHERSIEEEIEFEIT